MVSFDMGMCADSAYALLTFSGTPKLSMSSPLCNTRCILMVLFNIPPERRGATNCISLINQETVMTDFFADDLRISVFFNQECHSRRHVIRLFQSRMNSLMPNFFSFACLGPQFPKLSKKRVVWKEMSITIEHPAYSWPGRLAAVEKPLEKHTRGRSRSL